MSRVVLVGAIVCLALASLVLAAPPKWSELEGYTFERYLKDFGKDYSVPEQRRRERIFNAKLAEVKAHNADLTRSWRKGINHLSDWSAEELRSLRGYRPDPKIRAMAKTASPPAGPVPMSMDYRMNNPAVLTAVKDQGQCGSCWAFSAAETLETYAALATGQLNVLSPQQIADCTLNPRQCGGSGGCFGGTYGLGWASVQAMGGIAEEWTYPYDIYWGGRKACRFNINRTFPVANVNGFVQTTMNDDSELLHTLANVGPLAVAVDASGWSDYESGVYTGCNYAVNISIDHGVQLVGYGYDAFAAMDYWLIRNSWTPMWGEDGFIRIYRPALNAPQQCGWNVNNTDGMGCLGGPNSVWTCGTCGIAQDAAYVVMAQ